MTIRIDGTCPVCSNSWTVIVPKEAWDRYQEGALIQEALPMLTTDERELLISKICSPCFDLMYADEDDD